MAARAVTKRDKVTVVCARITAPLMIPDNRTGRCDECGWKVQFRPHAPAGRRMCMDCAVTLLGPDDKFETTPRMLKDLATYIRRKLQ